MVDSPENREKFLDPIKKAGVDAAQNLIIECIKEMAYYMGKIIKDYMKDVYDDSRKRKEKYNSIMELRIQSESNLESLQKAIIEAKFIVDLTQHDLNSLNKINPVHLVKYQVLSSRLEQWKNLLQSIETSMGLTLITEVLEAMRTKKESSFFNNQPKIQQAVLAINSDEEYKKFLSEVKTKYNASLNKDN